MYCDYDMSLKLKELGFKEMTSAYYMPNNKALIYNYSPYRGSIIDDMFFSRNSLRDNCMGSECIDAPTVWEVQEWLEKRCISLSTKPYVCEDGVRWLCEIREFSNEKISLWKTVTCCISSKHALYSGIQQVLIFMYDQRDNVR